MNIGGKIRDLRLRNGLTLEELASRSELTKGFLSQVERDLTSPSIATLEDILEALGTDLSHFFQEEKDVQIVFKSQDFFVDEREDMTIEYVVPNAQKNEMEPIVVTLYPNQRSQEMTCFEGEEFGYVLSGSVQLIIGNKVYKISKGETFYLSGKKTHYLFNNTSKNAKVLWVTTPPMF